MTKRQFTAEYKTKIVLELLREEQNLSEIASKNDISPNQLRNWKREFLENAAKAFSGSKQEREAKYRDKVTEEEKQEPGKVIDLMDALKASVKNAKNLILPTIADIIRIDTEIKEEIYKKYEEN